MSAEIDLDERPDVLQRLRYIKELSDWLVQLESYSLQRELRRMGSSEPQLSAHLCAVNRCPQCGSGCDLRHDQTRHYERLVKWVTHKRPYRCKECQWRGWLVPEILEEYAWRGEPEVEDFRARSGNGQTGGDLAKAGVPTEA